ncbi:hypothetical protein JW859_13190 [bacterium]|nr:hypothetical protein [bacterium]
MQTLTELEQQRIKRLYRAVARVCAEIGCQCLAERFDVGLLDLEQQSCPVCGKQACKALPHLLAKLAPLVRALDGAGYHDLALMSAKIALDYEPTLDLHLDYAYLNLILGENKEAVRTYAGILRDYGSIDSATLERVEAMSRCHCSEDDIAALCQELRNYVRRKSQNA